MEKHAADELSSLNPAYRIDIKSLTQTDSINAVVEKIYKELSGDIFFFKLRNLMQDSFMEKKGDDSSDSKAIDTESFEILSTTITNIFERNRMLHMHNNEKKERKIVTRSSSDEQIPHIRSVRLAWEQGINEELGAIATEAKRSYIIKRPPNQINKFLLPNSARNDNVRFLYDSDDLMETVCSVRYPKSTILNGDLTVGMIKISVDVPSWGKLRTKYANLNPQFSHLGLDELGTNWSNKLLISRHEEAECIVAYGSCLDSRHFLQRGAPASMRGQLWRHSMGMHREKSQKEQLEFERLRQLCDDYDFLTDELFIHDVQTVVDDPKFFVFEEELKEVSLCFSRDDWVRHESHYLIHNLLLGCIDCSDFNSASSMPPSAVQPFLGLALYNGPVCYVFRDRATLYTTCRMLYTRLWCGLNVISSDKGTLVSVCRLFESLLMTTNPKLFLHLVRLGVQPLQVAFTWIHQAFVNYLEIDQLLHLWDRVIAYQDLNVLAVFAASIFAWRSETLFMCETSAQVLAILNEGTRLRVVPLIQLFLFPEGPDAV